MSSEPEQCAFLKERRPLGQTGLKVSPLGFGGGPLGNMYGEIDATVLTHLSRASTLEQEQSAIQAVHEAVKYGINLFDVSPYYGDTMAETVLGKALRDLPRDAFVLSTKVGRYGVSTFDFSAERVTKSVEESMRRLNVDTIDVIQCHDIEFGDLDMVVKETIPALLKLKADGKVRAIGITGYPLEIFPYVLACVEPDAVDVALSYCNYNLQNDRLANLLPWFENRGMGVINASPLCMGLLTESGGPKWHPADEAIKAAAREANTLCENSGTKLADVALKFAVDAEASQIASTLVGIDSVKTLYKNIRSVQRAQDDGLLKKVRGLFEPVRNRRWSSGFFDGPTQ